MTHRQSSSFIPRRAMLAGMGAGAAAMFLRPMFASAAGVTPTRLLIVHRPCGTRPEAFFPSGGSNTQFSLDFTANVGGVTIPSITKAFTPLIGDMVLLNGITCPRDHSWNGDQHSAGLITMMTGKQFIGIPGAAPLSSDSNSKFLVANGASIDQLLLKDKATNLGAAPLGSIQSTAYRPSSLGLPSFRVMSYSGSNAPLFPESRPGTLFSQIFASAATGLSQDQVMRMQAQNKSVLDFVNKDLTRLRTHVPASQFGKLDAHLDTIQQLEKSIAAISAGASCAKPTQEALPALTTNDAADEDSMHLAVARNQLGIIMAAFQCDLTRVATFSFAHGNSALEFAHVTPEFTAKKGSGTDGDGHHNISHDTTASLAQAQIDQIYCEQLATFLLKMKATPDGASNLLDNTLVVFFNEVGDGNSHGITQMPVAMFGGKSLKLQTGQHLHFNNRYMNDVWTAVAAAFGSSIKYGDSMFTTTPVAGLFG